MILHTVGGSVPAVKSARWVLPVLLAGVAGWSVLSGCGSSGPARRIVLISIDTCRPDHLGCYGYSKPTTPHIDAVAAEGALFTQARSHVPITLPSHCSMLTGTLPPVHGVRDATGFRLGAETQTLAELLKTRGFRTGAVLGAYVLDRSFGLDQGFDSYDDGGMAQAGAPERRCEEVTSAALSWLEHHQRDDFFLFLHFYDPHLSYSPPEPFAAKFADSPYAGEIAYTDHCVGQVVDKLKSLKLYDSSLIVITADHGEGLGEHTEVGHGYFIYDSTLRVPLVIKRPGQQRPVRVEEAVGLIDIAPTILAAAGIEIPALVQGRDLTPLLEGGKSEAGGGPVYCESMLPTKFGCSALLGLVSQGFKYVHAPRPELYDLGADAAESRDLAAAEPARVTGLQQELKQSLLAQPGQPSAAQATLDPEAVARLEALGYLGGRNVSPTLDLESGGEDPKDFAPIYNGFMRARALFSDGDFSLARAAGEEVAAVRPSFDEIHNLLGRIALAQGRTDAAVEYFSRYLELLEAQGKGAVGADAHESLATLLLRRGDADTALPHLQALVQLRPEDASVHSRLGFLLAHRRQLDQALAHWREAVRLGSADAEVRIQMGEALVNTGDLEGGVREWTEALRLEPWHIQPRLNLGAALILLGRPEEAAAQLGEVIKAKPDMAKGHRLLGMALYRQGKVEEALERWEEALRYDPKDPSTLEAEAWALATCDRPGTRNPARAIQLAEAARQLTGGREPGAIKSLAAALAAAGRYPDAAAAAEESIRLLAGAGREAEAAEVRAQRDLYRAGKAYVEPPQGPGMSPPGPGTSPP